jgi:PEP-CTERM motif
MRNNSLRLAALLPILWFADLSRAGSFTFTSISVPGSLDTRLFGISNNGVAVGYYDDPSGNSHGFEVLPNGTLVYPFDDPSGVTVLVGNPPATVTNTDFREINDAGTIVGGFGLLDTGFILKGGTYSTYSVGGGSTEYLAINDQGDVAGTNDIAGQLGGFIVIGNASPVFVNVPGAFETVISGINDADYTWGNYLVYNGSSSIPYAFVRAPDGTITTVGQEQTGAAAQPLFLAVSDDGTLIPFPDFSVPGGVATQTSQMNDSGEFVGTYFNGTGTEAFIAFSTPEPSSLGLAALGMLGIAATLLRRARLKRPQSNLL